MAQGMQGTQGAQGMQGAPGMPGPRASRPPVRIATALVLLAALSVLVDVAGYLWLLTPWSVGAMEPDRALLMLFAIGVILVALLSIALWLATVVLAILTMVWGRGAMRVGALLVLLPITISTFVSADISGDSDGAQTARSILHVVGIVADWIGIALVVVGIVLLLRGIREARRM